MSNYSIGHDAEKAVAEFLITKGYEISELNWRNRLAEIDIIAKRHGTIYFVEVKSRKDSSHGQGYEYITKNKLKQMQFAAEMWVNENKWEGDYELAVVSVDSGEMTLITEIYP